MNQIKKLFVGPAFSRLLAGLLRNWSWALLLLFVLFIKLFAADAARVEFYYSQAFYPVLAGTMRGLLGWLPLSFGDILYGLVGIYCISKFIALLKKLTTRSIPLPRWRMVFGKLLFLFLIIYVLFNLLWGLNYNRLGIGSQLELTPSNVSKEDIDTLTVRLLAKANEYAILVETTTRQDFYNKEKLFKTAQLEVQNASSKYPFLKAKLGAVKPSVYSYAGNYLGFQGYYNPFTGEGQVNTTIPVFLRPFVTTHEIAHQLGYAKESEANFVGFLVCREASEPLFRYSAYLDMYMYAHAILFQMDSARAHAVKLQRNNQVQSDIQALKVFYQQYQTPLEELVMQGYDYFLQANEQPQGKQSYSQVLRWLMAWVRKNGWEAL
jgi:hypothetical protein